MLFTPCAPHKLSGICPSSSNDASLPAWSPYADSTDDGAFDGSHPVDVKAALEAAAQEGSSLVWTVPWVVRYLWFLGWDAEGLARSAYFRCARSWVVVPLH